MQHCMYEPGSSAFLNSRASISPAVDSVRWSNMGPFIPGFSGSVFHPSSAILVPLPVYLDLLFSSSFLPWISSFSLSANLWIISESTGRYSLFHKTLMICGWPWFWFERTSITWESWSCWFVSTHFHLFLFWNEVSCIPDWPPISCGAADDFGSLLFFLSAGRTDMHRHLWVSLLLVEVYGLLNFIFLKCCVRIYCLKVLFLLSVPVCFFVLCV